MRPSKWHAYWIGLAAALLAVNFWRNRRKYRVESRLWCTGKSLADTSLVCLLAVFCPPLLIAYSVLWLAQFVSDEPIWKTTFSILAGISLAAVGGWFLEIVIVIGLFAVDLVTSRFLHHWKTADNRGNG